MKVIIIGPFPNPITGNSLANQVVFENLQRFHSNVSVDRINTSYSSLKEDLGKLSFSKVLYYLKQYVGIVKIFSCDKLYYTSGQTFYGVLKYLPYLLVAKLLSKEILVHIHGNYLHKEFASLQGVKRFLFRKTIQLCDKGIVLSKSLRKNLTPFLSDNKIFELENFVEDFLFEGERNKNFDKLRIIYLSNLMTEKGIFDLLDALSILYDNNVVFDAKIAGGLDASIEKEISQRIHDMPSHVDYLGLVYGSQKKELLEWGNVFVLPTKFDEGQPISILESMAFGCIVFPTKQGGIPDVFKENVNGFYIDKASPDSIVSKLQIMSQNMFEYKRISEHNIKEASEKYRVKSFINKLYNILNE